MKKKKLLILCIVFGVFICVITASKKSEPDHSLLISGGIGSALLKQEAYIISIDKDNKILRVSLVNKSADSLFPPDQNELLLKYDELVPHNLRLAPGDRIIFYFFYSAIGKSPMRTSSIKAAQKAAH